MGIPAAKIRWAKAHPQMGSDWLPWPRRYSDQAAGWDLAAAIDKPLEIRPMERRLVPLGFKMALPAGWEAQIRPRSGLAVRRGLTLMNSPGTIDADYRGEVTALVLWCPDPGWRTKLFTIVPGMRIAQMIITRVPTVTFEEVADLADFPSARAEGGFGSTGTGAGGPKVEQLAPAHHDGRGFGSSWRYLKARLGADQ